MTEVFVVCTLAWEGLPKPATGLMVVTDEAAIRRAKEASARFKAEQGIAVLSKTDLEMPKWK